MIDIRIYGDYGASPSIIFSQLLRTISAWPQAMGSWNNFCAREESILKRIAVNTSPISMTEIEELGYFYDDPSHMLSADINFRCWTFDDELPKEEEFLLSINAWGSRYADSGDTRFNDANLDGYASINIRRPSHYYAALEADSTHEDMIEINSCVKNNIDNILNVIVSLIERIRPESLKVFDDEGLRLPFNAHYAYYRDISGVVRELKYLAKLWENGLRWYPKDPSLKEFKPQHHSAYFHLSRTEAERQLLWERLSYSLLYVDLVSEETVKKVLKDQPPSFSMLLNDQSITVLSYPFFMNYFIDEFFLSVLSPNV